MGKLALKPQQDGLGYYYGEYETNDGKKLRIDLQPPQTHPNPYFVNRPAEEFDPVDWIVYVGGVEVARVRERDDVYQLDILKLIQKS